MSSQQLDEERIFHIARELAKAEARSEYLDQICAGDQQLRERVDALLEVHEKEAEFLESSPEAVPTVDHMPIAETAGQQIGRFKLLQQIGEGGFGVVYMAEQTRPVRRKVALKIIKPGMDTHAVVARFEAERQALAMMDHPNISRVLDGGTTDTGRPYFVMELVKGVPVTEYCDKNNSPTQERLELFITICQAVQHAHQKGIIHRDLKPSNILVTLHDGQPMIKVIDFGIAKAINQQLTEKTLFTAYGQMVGTPQYMSPEQAEMSGLDVDTRSDIYSLGVLLYELLTGTTPLEAEQLRSAGFTEMQRLIREQEPPKPSTRLSSTGEQLTIIAKHRSADPDRLQKQVAGDLDWIVMKALEKDRGRRYETANEIAADVDRHLKDEPVEARPPTVGYRIQKYLRRHRSLVAGMAVIVAALILGIVGLAVGLRGAMSAKAAIEQRNSQLERARAELEQRNLDLAAALQRWSNQIFQRAMTAAVLIDEETVDSLINNLKAVGINPRWEAKVRALLALHRGDTITALQILDQAAAAAPEDAGIVALMAKVCLDSGKHDQYLNWKSKLNQLEPATDEDTLLVGLALIYSDIERGEEMMSELVKRNPTPLALAVHSEALMKLHSKTGDESYRDRADDELSAAKWMMPDNALVALMEFYAHFGAALDGDVSQTRQKLLEDAYLELAKYEHHPIAKHGRASYLDWSKQFSEANKEWESMDDSQSGAWHIYYAASRYRQGDYAIAIEILDRLPEQYLINYYFGEACALEPSRGDKALAIYKQLVGASEELTFGPDDVVGIPEMILLLMGDLASAREAAVSRLDSSDVQGWNRSILEFIGNAEAAPDDLLNRAANRFDRVYAHKIIAAKFLSTGDVEDASVQLDLCQKSFPMAPEAYWAEALKSRLETDPVWRRWLEQRKTRNN